MTELLTFQQFDDPALAENLTEIFRENGIEFVLEEGMGAYNLAQVNQAKTYAVKIKSADFEKAHSILNNYESQFTNDVEPDYYLLDFSVAELREVVAKRDEWSAFDYALAKKLLAEKGFAIDDAAEKRLGEERIKELKTPERTENTWVMFGYIFAICGGVLGFFIGWQLWKSKKTLPNGEQVYTYNKDDQQSGKQIFYLSIAGVLIGIVYKIFAIS